MVSRTNPQGDQWFTRRAPADADRPLQLTISQCLSSTLRLSLFQGSVVIDTRRREMDDVDRNHGSPCHCVACTI